jgi:hypothetical protein
MVLECTITAASELKPVTANAVAITSVLITGFTYFVFTVC